MLKKLISYTDSDGNLAQEEVYFNLTSAELMKLELSENLMSRVEKVQTPGTAGSFIIETFDMILRAAYGIRTDEGKFIKPYGVYDEWMASEAYSVLLFELATNAEKGAEFFNAVMPRDLIERAKKVQNNEPTQNVFELPQPAEKDIDPNITRAKNGLSQNPNDMSEDELLRSLGVEERHTAGFTDEQIKQMSGAMLAKQPREVLVRAFQLKNQK